MKVKRKVSASLYPILLILVWNGEAWQKIPKSNKEGVLDITFYEENASPFRA
jgi:hypothetical protein